MTQLAMPETRNLRAQSPVQLLSAALQWISENPDGWQLIVSDARRDAGTYRRVRIKHSIETIRMARLIVEGENLKLPNALSAPFGRILAKWHPELAEYIPLHHSKVDGCSIPPRPY